MPIGTDTRRPSSTWVRTAILVSRMIVATVSISVSLIVRSLVLSGRSSSADYPLHSCRHTGPADLRHPTAHLTDVGAHLGCSVPSRGAATRGEAVSLARDAGLIG